MLQFFITFGPAAHLDGRHVVFGRVVEGQNIVKLMEDVETDQEKPRKEVKVHDCGQLPAQQ